MTPDSIVAYLEQFGNPFTQQTENTWITSIRTSVANFQVIIRLSKHWVFFFINPFVVKPEKLTVIDRMRLYYHALRYNHNLNLCKLGIDKDGDLFLSVELPQENFEYSHFDDALNALAHHAGKIYMELMLISQRPDSSFGEFDKEIRMPVVRDGSDEPDDEDVYIAGKRLTITTDLEGITRVELESERDNDEDEAEDNTEDAV